MNANQMRYVLDESFTMMNRRRGSNVVSVVIMGLSLLILVVFLLITLNVSGVIGAASEELRVYVYLKNGIGTDAARDIQMRLLALKEVEGVEFVSRAEALVEMKQWLGDNQDMLGVLEENPLPDAYRVKVKSAYIRTEALVAMAKQVGDWSGVEDVRYGERWLERGEKLVKGFYVADLAIGFIIFLSVIFVIANTVRLTVLSRAKAIEVAKLVGATNAYIRIPFLVEGAVQGAVAALLAIGLLAVVHAVAKRYMPGLLFLPGEAAAGFVLFCALLGAIGSWGAMRRFLKI